MIIHCSNPTCAASISVQNLRWDANPETVTKIATEHYGWPTEQHADDDRPRIYCPRCKL